MVHVAVPMPVDMTVMFLMYGMANTKSLEQEHRSESGENREPKNRWVINEDVVSVVGSVSCGMKTLRNHDEQC